MKEKIKAFFNSLKAFISEHSTVLFIAVLLLVAIVLTLVYKGLPDDVSSKNDGNTNSIVSTEDTTSDENSVSSDIEQTNPDNEQTEPDDEQTTSKQPVNSKPSNKKPSTSSPGTSSTDKNENIVSKPSNDSSNNTSTTTVIVPSSAALKDSGLTLEESQAIVEAAKTCRHCGQSTGGSHHRYGIDVTCPDCGELAKANTCHFCK